MRIKFFLAALVLFTGAGWAEEKNTVQNALEDWRKPSSGLIQINDRPIVDDKNIPTRCSVCRKSFENPSGQHIGMLIQFSADGDIARVAWQCVCAIVRQFKAYENIKRLEAEQQARLLSEQGINHDDAFLGL